MVPFSEAWWQRADLLSGRQRHGPGRPPRRPRRDHDAAHLGRAPRRWPPTTSRSSPASCSRRRPGTRCADRHRPSRPAGVRRRPGVRLPSVPRRASRAPRAALVVTGCRVTLLCLHRWARTRSRWRWPVAASRSLLAGADLRLLLLLLGSCSSPAGPSGSRCAARHWTQRAELAAALAAPLGAAAPVLWRYRTTRTRRSGCRRSITEIEQLSADIAGFWRDAVDAGVVEPAGRAGHPEVAPCSRHSPRSAVVMLAVWLEPRPRRRVRHGWRRSGWPASAWPSSRPGVASWRTTLGPFACRLGPMPVVGEQPLQADVGGRRLRAGVAGDAASRPRRVEPPVAVRLLRPRDSGDVGAGRSGRPPGSSASACSTRRPTPG